MSEYSRTVAKLGALIFVGFGIWAMVAPANFFETFAVYEPYNRHFILDIGAFQIGLGAVLALAAWWSSDALTVALVGVGIGGVAHTISHALSINDGGNPATDIPALGFLGLGLLVVGFLRHRRT